MTIREGIAAAMALAALALAIIIGSAVRATWTSTHTTAALVGGLFVLGFALYAVSQAIGVELSARRPGAGAPAALHMTAGGGAHPVDPTTAHMQLLRLMDQQLRVQQRLDQRSLQAPPSLPDDLGQWAAPVWLGQDEGQPMVRPDGGWGA